MFIRNKTEAMPAEIVRLLPEDQAYIHFCDSDRRHDTTVPLKSLRALSSQDPGLRLDVGPPGQVRNIDRIIIGGFSIDAWYHSPFLGFSTNLPVIHICEFCLEYFEDVYE
jgi:hypothetical protein